MNRICLALVFLTGASFVFAETNRVAEATEPNPHEPRNEIIVTATRVERDALTRPATEPIGLKIASSEVTAEDMMRQNSATLTDALNYAPGAWTETRGRKVKQFTSFRGQTYPYPDYAIDGMWFREFHELPYFFPTYDVDRIEIMRSSAALMTGLSGLSGVMNVIPRQDAERTTRLEAAYGTDNSQRYHVSHSEPVPDGSVMVSAGRQSTDGEEGRNAAEQINTGSIRLSWAPGDSLEMDAFLFFLEGSRELEKAEAPASNGLRNREEEFNPLQTILFGTRLRYHETGSASTELSVWGSDRKARYQNHTAGTEHDDDDYEYGLQLLQSIALFNNNILRFGGLYHRWVAPDGKRFYAGKRNDIETLSAVVVDEHDFGKLKVDLGYRYSREYINDYAAYNIEGSGGGFRTVDPIEDEWAAPLHRANLGGAYALNPALSLYANYSFGQMDAPTGASTDAGDALGQEGRHMLDAGVEFNAAAYGTIKTGLFGVYKEEGIHITANTYTNAIGVEVPYYENRDGRQYGFEAEWRSPWYGGRAALFASTQLMHSEATDDQGDYQTDLEIPEQIYAAGIYLREGRFDASFFGKYVGAYENDRFSSSGPQPLGDYAVLNCTAGYTFGQRAQTRTYIALNNLLDDEYSSVVGYYDRGFRISGGLQCTF